MDDTAPALLEVLRHRLDRPGLRYAEPPEVMRGGFWAEIIAIRLAGAPPELSGPLVARVMPDEPVSAREIVVQREVANAGFPAPKVRLSGTASDGLGRPFVLMDRAPGAPLLSGLTPARAIVSVPRLVRRLPKLLASTALQLHLLDPEPIRNAVRREVPDASLDVTDMVRNLRFAAERHDDPFLLATTDWLRANQPEPQRVCLGHGDLHPFNLLAGPDGSVTLVDWTSATISEPAFDLAFTTLTFRYAPVGLPPRLRPALLKAASWVADRILAIYRDMAAPHGIALDDRHLEWHTVLHGTRVLLEAADLRAGGGRPGHPFLTMGGEVRDEVARITAAQPVSRATERP
jgi:aminoglycoside phosphotransferase (APT) family kinase protein